MSLISLAEYAKKHGRDPATCRQMAIRGGFQTARKIGRNWVIDSEEPYPDRRRKADVTADVTASEKSYFVLNTIKT